MSYQEIQENWKIFSNLIKHFPAPKDEHMTLIIKRYIEQNIIVLNDVLSASIENLEKLQQSKTTNDIICTQAKLTSDISRKLSLSAQRFLNTSLGNIADYNEWLKAHCDMATD